jgi:hypothetical protein
MYVRLSLSGWPWWQLQLTFILPLCQLHHTSQRNKHDDPPHGEQL